MASAAASCARWPRARRPPWCRVLPDLRPLRRPRLLGPRRAPPASPPRPAARPSGPPQTFLAGAPLRPSSMAPFPSWRRRDHGGARLRQSDSRGGAEAGRAVRGAARRTARTASAAARGGPRARRRWRLGVLVLPRSSLSGAPLSWLWRRPVTAAMAARSGQAMAAARPWRRPGRGASVRPRRPAHGGLTRRNRPSTAALLAPAEDGARAGPLQGLVACVSGGVRVSAAYGGERWRARVRAGPWRAAATKAIGKKGRADGSSARVTRAATMVSRSVATMVSWSVSWGMNLTSGVHLSVRRST